MPKGPSNLSAVARRRLQKDAPAALAPDLPTSNNNNISTSVKRPRITGEEDGPQPNKIQRKLSEDRTTASVADASSSMDPLFANSFDGLAQHGYNKDETGKIEHISPSRVRVLIMKGKKVFVTGTYSLWVKSGAVSIYGAKLTATETLHHVYAPFLHSIPTIEVLSDLAEIELNGLDEGLQALAKLHAKDVWLPPAGAKLAGSTFFILGHHFSMEPNMIPQHELDITRWFPILAQIPTSGISRTNGTSLSSRIVLNGKRSSGASVFLRCLINRLLTARHKSGKLENKQVMLIDFDDELPECAPPGMLSVARITKPIIGPAFTHSNSAMQMIKMHFVADRHPRTLSCNIAEAMSDLIHVEQTQDAHQCPVVIRLPPSVESAGRHAMERLWKSTQATELVQVDGIFDTGLQALASVDGIPVRRITPIVADTKLSFSEDCDLRIQSYFHGCRSSSLFTQWNNAPLPAISDVRQGISFGKSDNPSAVLVLDQLVDPEDTLDAILGNIGVIVTITRDGYDQNLRRDVRTIANGFPLLSLSTMSAISPVHSECLGMALVAEIQTEPPQVTLCTPITPSRLGADQRRVLLLIHPGRTRGQWFGTEWVSKEAATD